VKVVLKRQNSSCFGNLKHKVLEARDNLDLAQKEVLASFGRADYLLKENECLHVYVSITKAEESFLKQKARNQWLQLGDQNNSFFHHTLRIQNAKSTMKLTERPRSHRCLKAPLLSLNIIRKVNGT
jgi:hypothetical protein